jgi:hypothetical protein
MHRGRAPALLGLFSIVEMFTLNDEHHQTAQSWLLQIDAILDAVARTLG